MTDMTKILPCGSLSIRHAVWKAVGQTTKKARQPKLTGEFDHQGR